MSYEIEKNIPLPAHGGKANYPFAKMEIGDSFFERCSGEQRAKVHARLSVAATAAKRHGKGTFTTRLVADGVRVFRIA